MSTAICLKEGNLYRYNGGGLLSFKKTWKQCYGVLTDDSVLKLYKDQTQTSKTGELNFQNSVLWLAFGKDAEKYDPPKSTDVPKDQAEIIEKALENKCYIAIPKDKNRNSIIWLAVDNASVLHEWIRAVALTVKSKYKPPILGAKRSDYKRIIHELRQHFNIDENTEEWEAYWLYTVLGDRASPQTFEMVQGASDDENDRDNSAPKIVFTLEKIESRLIENEEDELVEKFFPISLQRQNDGNLFVVEQNDQVKVERIEKSEADRFDEVKGQIVEPMAEINSAEQRHSYKTTLEININKRQSEELMAV